VWLGVGIVFGLVLGVGEVLGCVGVGLGLGQGHGVGVGHGTVVPVEVSDFLI